MSNTKEYKDNSGEWRLTHKAKNGNITLASTEGYKNKKDMQESMINACKQVLEFYGVNTWISIKDKLPEKYEDVLVFSEINGILSDRLEFINKNGEIYFYGSRDEYDNTVTHWMPLPEPPK